MFKLKWIVETPISSRDVVSSLFLRSLSLIFLITFSNILWQKEIITSDGLIPFVDFADKTIQNDGLASVMVYPSIFWISQSDLFIELILVLAIVISLLNLIWRQFMISYILQWFLYLSIVTFGRDVFQFPWDTFLLELGFLSIFAVYFKNRGQFPRLLLFAFLLLFFRQWASMALTKILWSSEYWSNLSYMKHFWLVQPSPTPIGCILSKLPDEIQKSITVMTLVLESLIALSIIFGRRGRIISFLISLFLSVLIEMSGNFGFFNLLTIVAGIWCLDDCFLLKLNIHPVKSPKQKLCSSLPLALLSIVVVFNFYYLIQLTIKQDNHANFMNYRLAKVDENSSFLEHSFFSLGKFVSNWRVVSPHGVFKHILPVRPYMKIYAVDTVGKRWPMTFRRGLEITDFSYCAPFMNRLQYLFYYQSLGFEFRSRLLDLNPNGAYLNSWMKSLVLGILENKHPNQGLVEFGPIDRVDQVLIQQVLIRPECMRFDCFSECKNYLIIDSVLLTLHDQITTPLFQTENIFDFK